MCLPTKDQIGMSKQTIFWLRQSPSCIFLVVEGWSAWLQEGSLPNSLRCGLRLHGWLSTGSLPPGPCSRGNNLCVQPHYLIAQILVVSVVSCCLSAPAGLFFFFLFFAACFCMRGSEGGAALAADAGNQCVGKQWKIREAVDLRYPAQK